MAVKTSFRDEELSHLLGPYDIGDLLTASPTAEGTVQTNIRIGTTTGQYVFRYYENRTRSSAMFETDLLAFLQSSEFPAPVPQLTNAGIHVAMYRGKPYAIFGFMTGQRVNRLSWPQCADLIKHVALLHNVTKSYKPEISEDRAHYTRDFCSKRAQNLSRQAASQQGSDKAAWIDLQLSLLDLPETIPKGICHCDFDLSNLLFHGDRLTALLDFDDANYTYQSFDLVHLVESHAWPHGGEYDRIKACRVIREYQRNRAMDPLEIRHFFDVCKLSILVDSLWFFDRGRLPDFNEKRKIEFLDSIGREAFEEWLRDT
ncbi:MAG: phosphotransferase [Candidatus Latescibacteria bacterium]|nr:phosphotransferase [Candidatus Latescibacterota bacterium]